MLWVGAEIQIGQAYGRLVDVDEMEAAAVKEYAAIKQALLSLPTRIAGRAGGIELSNAILDVMKDEIDDILTELAHASPDMPSPQEVAAAMAIRERKGIARDLRVLPPQG